MRAKQSAGDVNAKDIQELSGKFQPPNGAVDILAGVLLLLGMFPDLSPPPKKKKGKVNVEQVIWTSAQKAMNRADFRRRLQNLDLDELQASDPDIASKLNAYTSKDHFNEDTFARRGTGKAAVGLCGWVVGMKDA